MKNKITLSRQEESKETPKLPGFGVYKLCSFKLANRIGSLTFRMLDWDGRGDGALIW